MDPDAALAPFASQIGPGLYISDPKPKDVDTSKRPLVFLGFWMNAPASQLARYVELNIETIANCSQLRSWR